MDHESVSSGRRMAPSNFEFAFNDSNFSDRMLRIEVMAEPSTLNFEDGTATIADWARNRKRRRAEAKRNAGILLLLLLLLLRLLRPLKHLYLTLLALQACVFLFVLMS